MKKCPDVSICIRSEGRLCKESDVDNQGGREHQKKNRADIVILVTDWK